MVGIARVYRWFECIYIIHPIGVQQDLWTIVPLWWLHLVRALMAGQSVSTTLSTHFGFCPENPFSPCLQTLHFPVFSTQWYPHPIFPTSHSSHTYYIHSLHPPVHHSIGHKPFQTEIAGWRHNHSLRSGHTNLISFSPGKYYFTHYTIDWPYFIAASLHSLSSISFSSHTEHPAEQRSFSMCSSCPQPHPRQRHCGPTCSLLCREAAGVMSAPSASCWLSPTGNWFSKYKALLKCCQSTGERVELRNPLVPWAL